MTRKDELIDFFEHSHTYLDYSLLDKIYEFITKKYLTEDWLFEFLEEVKPLGYNNRYAYWLLEGFRIEEGKFIYELQDHTKYYIKFIAKRNKNVKRDGHFSNPLEFKFPSSLFDVPTIKELILVDRYPGVPITAMALPDTIMTMENCTKVKIQLQFLKEFPNLTTMKNLDQLEIANTEIREIPDEITLNSKLTEIKIFLNRKLRRINTKLFELNNLKSLFLDHNKISHIPDDIKNLKRLEFLYIHNNGLKDIPEAIYSLNNLIELCISNNPIDKLSDNFVKLSSLREFRFTGTTISKLPNNFSKMENLFYVYLNRELQEGGRSMLRRDLNFPKIN